MSNSSPLASRTWKTLLGAEPLAQPLGLGVVEGQHGAARAEAGDGGEQILLGSRHLDGYRALDRRLLGVVLLGAAEHLAAQQEEGVGQLHQRPDAAQVAPQPQHGRGRLRVGDLARQPPHLGPAEAAGVDDLLRVAGQQHAREVLPAREGEDEGHFQLGQVLNLVADHDVVPLDLALAGFGPCFE